MLDDSTINKIAAGEVVDRPASIVKELVENSIDAKSTRIEVEIQSGGISLIRVTDNGSGMDESDARLAIQRHATSKISRVDDLFEIQTLGFRGEALPSIAAVSRFSMRTRIHDSDLGTQVLIVGGHEKDLGSIGCSIGTTIQVEDLFFNTPARKKFLKTNSTEANRVQEIVTKLALSHPEIAFKFLNGNRVSFQTSGETDLFNALGNIYGIETQAQMLKLDFTENDLHIGGFISKPNLIKSTRAWQTYLVNGRLVQSRAIAKAIDNAYRSLIPRVGFPLAVIDVTVPTNSIDINVHPQKAEIKFEDEGKIFHAVYHAIQDSLRIQSARNNIRDFAADASNQIPKHFPTSEQKNSARPALFETDIEQKFSEDLVPIEHGIPFENRPSDSLEPLGQIALCYIIARDRDDLYIIDQHAAHERILFDRLSARTDGIPAQQLLINLFLKFSPRESDLIEKNLDLFHNLGFTMELSGDDEFRLIEIPADVPNSDAESLIREIVTNLNDNHETSSDEIRKSVLAITACRAAIKAGMQLSSEHMKILLDELAATKYPYTCPHGRPTILKFSSNELASMFKRTGFDHSQEEKI